MSVESLRDVLVAQEQVNNGDDEEENLNDAHPVGKEDKVPTESSRLVGAINDRTIRMHLDGVANEVCHIACERDEVKDKQGKHARRVIGIPGSNRRMKSHHCVWRNVVVIRLGMRVLLKFRSKHSSSSLFKNGDVVAKRREQA